MSTLAVVEQILSNTTTPLSVREIVELAGDSLPTKSKTPDTVVARDLSMDLKKKGEDSRFIRTAPGRYTMRAQWMTVKNTESILSAALSQDRAAPISARPIPVASTAPRITNSQSN